MTSRDTKRRADHHPHASAPALPSWPRSNARALTGQCSWVPGRTCPAAVAQKSRIHAAMSRGASPMAGQEWGSGAVRNPPVVGGCQTSATWSCILPGSGSGPSLGFHVHPPACYQLASLGATYLTIPHGSSTTRRRHSYTPGLIPFPSRSMLV